MSMNAVRCFSEAKRRLWHILCSLYHLKSSSGLSANKQQAQVAFALILKP